MIIPETKEEQFNAIYPYFYSVVTAFYHNGTWDETTKLSFEKLQRAAKQLGLSALVVPNNGDYILIVEYLQLYNITAPKQ